MRAAQRWSGQASVCSLARLCVYEGKARATSVHCACSGSPGGIDYLGVIVNIHTVVSVNALCADNLTVSLQGLQLEKFSGGQKLKIVRRAC